jgi:hypothetical protein
MATDYKQFSKFYTPLKPEESDPTVRTFSTTEKKTKTNFYVFSYEIEFSTKREQQDVDQKVLHLISMFILNSLNNYYDYPNTPI